MTLRRRIVAPLAACALASLVAGCGVSLQSSAEPLPPNVLPAPLRIPTPSESPSASTPANPPVSPSAEPTASRLRLWFVQDDGLAAVESDLPVGSTAELVVQALAVGPPAGPAGQGLRTVARDPLTGQPLASVPVPSAEASVSPAPTNASAPASPATGPPVFEPAPTPGAVSVVLSAPFAALPPYEQVLLLGQVVLSLTGAGQSSVSFVDESGAPLAVPLPDGRLLDMPATARDYAGLIVRL